MNDTTKENSRTFQRNLITSESVDETNRISLTLQLGEALEVVSRSLALDFVTAKHQPWEVWVRQL